MEDKFDLMVLKSTDILEDLESCGRMAKEDYVYVCQVIYTLKYYAQAFLRANQNKIEVVQ